MIYKPFEYKKSKDDELVKPTTNSSRFYEVFYVVLTPAFSFSEWAQTTHAHDHLDKNIDIRSPNKWNSWHIGMWFVCTFCPFGEWSTCHKLFIFVSNELSLYLVFFYFYESKIRNLPISRMSKRYVLIGITISIWIGANKISCIDTSYHYYYLNSYFW